MSSTIRPPTLADVLQKISNIDNTLAAISAKEVLFIITISILALLALAQLILLISNRKKSINQNSVPQAIVIQPNGGNERSSKLQKDRVSSYEKDVLPSKSMKMKVSILPGQISSKRIREGIDETPIPMMKEASPSPSSCNERVTKKGNDQAVGAPAAVTATATAASVNQSVDVSLSSDLFSASSLAPTQTQNPSNLTSSATTATALTSSLEKQSKPIDSMTSFTVPEGLTPKSATAAPTSQYLAPGATVGPAAPPPPPTPTATTLSGNEKATQPVTSSSNVTTPEKKI